MEKKIIHLITGLSDGGAQKMLYTLLKNIDRKKYNLEVISMMDKGVYGDKIENLGIKVHCLNMKRGRLSFSAIFRLCKLIKKADILQTWMYHANFLGYIATRFVHVKKVIWGIRHSNLDKDKNKAMTLRIVKLCAKLSRRIDYIICCSDSAADVHIGCGYDHDRIITIYNGFELDRFKYYKEAKGLLLQELDIKDNPFIISVVGRWHVLKDHNNFFKALDLVKQKKNNCIAILCGENINYDNSELVDIISKDDLGDRVRLLGRRDDVHRIMSASDLLVLSSSGEAFPNVVGEAMACETTCVVTDVGDSASIVGDTGLVVEKQNHKQLAEAIIKIMNLSEDELNKLGKKSRERIISNFDITNIVKEYEELYV
ncbi:glycosyltransferase [Wukongibacter baidiensis]|uniref:glycosyltransferase family 4 protein n=1 Tax=Wukongibacter baidiensis TaxID=1723361 RepID=UPI003D7FB00B